MIKETLSRFSRWYERINGKQTKVDDVLKNDEVRAAVNDYIESNLNRSTKIIIIYGFGGENYDTYMAGFDTPTAVGILDLMKHKIEHYGLPE